MIDIYDDVLEEHNAILVDDAIKQLSWKYFKPQCTNTSLQKIMMLILILESI